MISCRVLVWILIAMPVALATRALLADDDLVDLVGSGRGKERVLVKRRISEDNDDRNLKQISLSALVGNLEKNLFASALSFNKNLRGTAVSATESNVVEMHSEAAAVMDTTTTQSINVAEDGAPLPLVVDHIATQAHTEGVALTPLFEFKQKINNDEEANRELGVAKVTTRAADSVTAAPDLARTSLALNLPSVASMTPITEAAVPADTTTKSTEQLKEAEEELKETFAEIEAEPVILSARV